MADTPQTPPPTPPAPEGGTGTVGATVPSSRLREETERAQAAEARAQAAEAQVQGLTAARAQWETERAIYQAGITDPGGVEVARLFHGLLPAQDRPAIGQWLGSLTPETAPAGLAAYLPRRGGTAPAPAPAAPAVPTAPVVAPQGAVPATTTLAAPPTPPTTTGAGAKSAGYDAKQIAVLREEARRTGDYSKLKAAMPEILKSVGPR